MLTQPGTAAATDAALLSDADPLAAFSDRSLLIVDDDKPFQTRLARAMESRGYHVQVADSVADGVSAVEARAPAFAVIDMRLGDGNGLDVIARLKERRPEARGVILTGADVFMVGRGAAPHAVRVGVSMPARREEVRHGLEVIADLLTSPASASLSVV